MAGKRQVSLCGYVAQLISSPPINNDFGHSHDPSNYLNSQIGKGKGYCTPATSTPTIISLHDSSTFYLSIFIHSIHLHGITRLRRQDSSFIADAVCQRRSVVSGVRVSSHEAVGLIKHGQRRRRNPSLLLHLSKRDSWSLYCSIRPIRAASTSRCHDSLDLHHLIAFGVPLRHHLTNC